MNHLNIMRKFIKYQKSNDTLEDLLNFFTLTVLVVYFSIQLKKIRQYVLVVQVNSELILLTRKDFVVII